MEREIGVQIWTTTVGKHCLVYRLAYDVFIGLIATHIDLPPGIGHIGFVYNTILNVLHAAAIEFSNGIPTADWCERFVLNEIENVFPRVTVLKFELKVLSLVGCWHFRLLKLIKRGQVKITPKELIHGSPLYHSLSLFQVISAYPCRYESWGGFRQETICYRIRSTVY